MEGTERAVEGNFAGDLAEAVRIGLNQVESYAIYVLSPEQPDRIIAARKNSPLIFILKG